MRSLTGIDITIERFINRTEQIIDIRQWINFFQFLRVENMKIKTGELTYTLYLAELIEPILMPGNSQCTASMKTDGRAGFFLQNAVIEFHAMRPQIHDRNVMRVVRTQASRVPG